MKISLAYFKCFDNKPIITEFEGTVEELESLENKFKFFINHKGGKRG